MRGGLNKATSFESENRHAPVAMTQFLSTALSGARIRRKLSANAVAIALIAATCGLAGTLRCEAAGARAVVELFTSQGCSSCPPADKLLGELAKDPRIIALTLPIDYWDYLGWKDTLANPHHSARQRAYVHMLGVSNVYTPQVVIDGEAQAVGSDRRKIENLIKTTYGSNGAMEVPLTIMVEDGTLKIATNGRAAVKGAEIWICGVSKQVHVKIGRGENHGNEFVYHNVVRRWLKVGNWNGEPATWSVPIENIAREGIDAAVAYLQEGTQSRPGAMLGAAFTNLN